MRTPTTRSSRGCSRLGVAALLGLTLAACGNKATLEPEPTPLALPAPPAAASESKVADAPPDPAASAGDPKALPVVGDPLGLLSRKSKVEQDIELAKRDPSRLDPAALAGADGQRGQAPALERDPRAVTRGREASARPAASTMVRELRLADLRNSVLGRTGPQVVMFYGPGCPACRSAMPSVVQAVRDYSGAARFMAVSIEPDRAALEAYVPALGAAFEPLWLNRSDAPRGALIKEARALGIRWGNDDGTVNIPFMAAFDAHGQVVRQGGSHELARLSKTLREL